MDNNTFYCIKLINNRTGKRGYVYDSPKGIMVTEDYFTPDCRQFKTYQEAQAFMRENKLERNGIKAYIRDNNDVMKEGKNDFLSPMDKTKEYWTMVSHEGFNVFFDTKEQAYYFDKKDVGYCIWHSEKDVLEAIDAMQLKGKVVTKKIA